MSQIKVEDKEIAFKLWSALRTSRQERENKYDPYDDGQDKALNARRKALFRSETTLSPEHGRYWGNTIEDADKQFLLEFAQSYGLRYNMARSVPTPRTYEHQQADNLDKAIAWLESDLSK